MPLSGAVENAKADIMTSLPLCIECKNQETWSPLKYMQQAKTSAKKHEIPVVVMSRNRLNEPLTMLELKDFIYLLQLASEAGNLKPEYGYQKRKQVGR
jgi:hypothetical protein